MTRTSRTLIFGGIAAILLGIAVNFLVQPKPTIFPEMGEMDIHPGEVFAIRFPKGVSDDVDVSLRENGEKSLQVNTRHSRDDMSLLVTPKEPLEWQTSYELCFSLGRGAILRFLPMRYRSCSTFRTMRIRGATGAPDAPILVAQGRDRPESGYYDAILQAEGLNAFADIPLESLTVADLSGRGVLILDSAALPDALIDPVIDWVKDGGLLISMRPGKELRKVLALPEVTEGILDNALLLPEDSSSISLGLSRAPFQIHGPIDRISAGSVENDARQGLAALAPSPGTPGGEQAVTLAKLGTGHIASFAFDVARSIVLTRQGNPLWVDQERDGSEPLRPNDLFYPDFISMAHAAIPAADELQRLLANLVVSLAPLPLPRYWYLPDKRRAALIMAGDDHATDGGTPRLFKWLDLLSESNCDVDAWECLRATAYLTPDTELDPELAKLYESKGFEIGAHVDTGCEKPIDRASLLQMLHAQIKGFDRRYPDLPEQQTHRMHCLSWTGWADVPLEELGMGIRFDLNYYLWPPEWIDGQQIFLTGSGFPMPFADLNGEVIDIYQAASHLVNQSGVPQEQGISRMLEGALGPDQYFGAFGTHYDFSEDYAQLLIGLGLEYHVALITAQQMLTWLDARNASGFSEMTWADGRLTFDIDLAPGAERASVLLPATFRNLRLVDVRCGTLQKPLDVENIKGLMMDFFPPQPGECAANYAL